MRIGTLTVPMSLQSCCPEDDPACNLSPSDDGFRLPSTCNAACAQKFNDMWDDCDEQILLFKSQSARTQLMAYANMCEAATGSSGH